MVRIQAVVADIRSPAEAAVASMGLTEAAVLVGLAVVEVMKAARMGFAVLGERLAVVGSRLFHSLVVAGWERGKSGGCRLVSRID